MEVSSNSQLIEIRRVEGLPVGTTVEVEMSGEAVKAFGLDSGDAFSGSGAQADWYRWTRPSVVRRLIVGPESEILTQRSRFSRW